LSEVQVVWLRCDLRLADNPALGAAASAGARILPVYVHEPPARDAPAGAASRCWLHHSLAALDARLRERGSRLLLRSGDPCRELMRLCAGSGATTVHYNGATEPLAAAADARICAALRTRGLRIEEHAPNLLAAPQGLLTQSGTPFQVYGAFRRRLLAGPAPAPPLPAPQRLRVPVRWPEPVALAELGLLPREDWHARMMGHWQAGEVSAQSSLRRFIDAHLDDYATARELPAQRGTSRLSPHLHFGELSVRQVWQALLDAARDAHRPATEAVGGRYAAELVWREFAAHLLWHFPHSATRELKPALAGFAWRRAPAALAAWQEGRTGIPLIDAGMRELWACGWMHNRVRMVVASFLVKNLRIHWLAGARWFQDTLVDADLASNTLGWQWVAGCGADAAPYFRIFNPVTQSQRHDPQGEYLRHWLPELARLDARSIHAPWLARPAALHAAGVRLGRDYPRPIVDLAASRAAALHAWRVARARPRA
jgi:deoxyribodipyrimidine photo-lyase